MAELPEAARSDLIRLVRLGHAQGMRRLLDAMAAENPALAATCSHLRGFVMRYEFESLLDLLTEDTHV